MKLRTAVKEQNFKSEKEARLFCEKQEKISLLGKNAIFLENLILILYDEMCHDTNKYVKLRKLRRLQRT